MPHVALGEGQRSAAAAAASPLLPLPCAAAAAGWQVGSSSSSWCRSLDATERFGSGGHGDAAMVGMVGLCGSESESGARRPTGWSGKQSLGAERLRSPPRRDSSEERANENATQTTPLTRFRRHEPVLGERGRTTEAGN